MKAKLFLTVILPIFMVSALITGCGKSDKEVKTGEKQSITDGSGKAVAVNVQESEIKWLGKKVTGQHDGIIKIKSGEIKHDNGKITGGKFEIDMNSITVQDLKDEEQNKKLTGHLKSDDFFGSDKYPTAKFEITKAEPLSDPNKPGMNYTITGNLNIKDITKSISFPANVKIENGVITASADFDIDRTEFNIRYGSGKFFDNLGDKMINDNFNIKLNLIAK